MTLSDVKHLHLRGVRNAIPPARKQPAIADTKPRKSPPGKWSHLTEKGEKGMSNDPELNKNYIDVYK